LADYLVNRVKLFSMVARSLFLATAATYPSGRTSQIPSGSGGGLRKVVSSTAACRAIKLFAAYYPTRTDLLAAVARVGMEAQLDAVRLLFKGISSAEQGADRIAAVTVRHENTRVLAALNQAADQEPAVRAVFNELLSGFMAEFGTLFEKLELTQTEARIDLFHALFVGLSVIDLATARRNGKARAKAVLNLAFQMLSEADQ
jgi:hypothetical protein